MLQNLKDQRDEVIPGYGTLFWFTNAYFNENMRYTLPDTGFQTESPIKVDTFAAYVQIERASRIPSDIA